MKAWNLMFISVGLILTLHFFGYPTGAVGTILDSLNVGIDNSDPLSPVLTNVTVTDSLWYNKLLDDAGSTKGILILLGLATAAIAASLITRAKPENLILLPIIITMGAFLSAYASLMTYVISQGQQWISLVITMIFLPIAAGFILALAEFFRGTD